MFVSMNVFVASKHISMLPVVYANPYLLDTNNITGRRLEKSQVALCLTSSECIVERGGEGGTDLSGDKRLHSVYS